jgi:hypothetical protein
MRVVEAMMRRVSLTVPLSVFVLAFAAVAPALASPSWHIASETVPTNLPPGGQGEFIGVISNLGDAPVEGGKEQVTITDKLPTGLQAITITGQIKNGTPVECTLATLTCTFKGVLYPYEQTTVAIKVRVSAGAGGSLSDQASVEGGGAAKATRKLTIPVSGEPAGYGPEDYELVPFNENGTPATQAGAHPFQLTTTLALNQIILEGGRQPVELPKDLSFHLPPGLVGNPNAVSQCTMANFFALVLETNVCSPSSVVGVATVIADEPKAFKVFTKTVPVFNLVPAQGEPARFGFEVVGRVPIVIDTSVRSGQDYGVDVSIKDATETAGLLSSQVTFWGVPGDPRHNNARGWECVAGEAFARQVGKTCPATSELPEEPFLTLPSSCAANPQTEPVVFPMETDSWAHPGSLLGAEYAWMNESGQPLGFEGCSQLPFNPAIDVIPEQHTAATPTGLSVDVKVPQQTTLEANGLAEADVRDTTVTLPQGVELSPSAANGLEGCTEAQVGFSGFNQASQTDEFNTQPASCSDGSKLGSVHIKTPLLSHELEGAVYLASPAPNGEAGRNPFNSLVALYIVAEDPVSGVLVKLAGRGELNEGTLRVATSFRNAPQVPFEDLKIDLFGGPRGSVSTPALCGGYGTDAVFTPWSGTGPVGLSSAPGEFEVTSGAGGGGCAGSPLGFSPGFSAQMASTQAGAFSPFTLEITRPDGDQALSGISMRLPPGVSGMLSSVRQCGEPQAAQGTCGEESLVGHAVESSGLGPEPYVVGGGRVYITGPYGGAPFGLSIVTPAVAGPFDLGTVVVRSRIFIDPSTAALTIVSDPLPTQLKGIPLQLKRVVVSIDRPDFQFNPTSCSPMNITGTLTGAQGAQAQVSSPFQVGGCGSLPFSPVFAIWTQGQTSKVNGASLTVRVTSTKGQANIAKTVLTLPKVLPARLTTLQKACLAATFEANPAACPEGSVVGSATVHTPVLSSPLTGPAYLVSHGNAAFPDVEFVLQGEGITLILDGQTNIKGGVTTSSFNAVPDAPVSSFETTLPEGPHSALGATSNLCGQTLTAPTTITGQNGALITQKTHVTITGCKAVKSYKATRAQLLAKALAVCRKKYKHHHTKRINCERQAHKRYPAKKTAHKTAKTRQHKGRP